jgi:hypothetical protein
VAYERVKLTYPIINHRRKAKCYLVEQHVTDIPSCFLQAAACMSEITNKGTRRNLGEGEAMFDKFTVPLSTGMKLMNDLR